MHTPSRESRQQQAKKAPMIRSITRKKPWKLLALELTFLSDKLKVLVLDSNLFIENISSLCEFRITYFSLKLLVR